MAPNERRLIAAPAVSTASQAERDHLDWVLRCVAKAVEDDEARRNHAREIQGQKRYL
mgnify:CR=1 FL=1